MARDAEDMVPDALPAVCPAIETFVWVLGERHLADERAIRALGAPDARRRLITGQDGYIRAVFGAWTTLRRFVVPEWTGRGHDPYYRNRLTAYARPSGEGELEPLETYERDEDYWSKV